MLPTTIIPLTGEEPHPDYGGWYRFITEHCDLRGEMDGVQYYGSANCNYLIWPCGSLVQNFGYHGEALLNRVADEGATPVLASVKAGYAELKRLLYGECK